MPIARREQLDARAVSSRDIISLTRDREPGCWSGGGCAFPPASPPRPTVQQIRESPSTRWPASPLCSRDGLLQASRCHQCSPGSLATGASQGRRKRIFWSWRSITTCTHHSHRSRRASWGAWRLNRRRPCIHPIASRLHSARTGQILPISDCGQERHPVTEEFIRHIDLRTPASQRLQRNSRPIDCTSQLLARRLPALTVSGL